MSIASGIEQQWPRSELFFAFSDALALLSLSLASDLETLPGKRGASGSDCTSAMVVMRAMLSMLALSAQSRWPKLSGRRLV
jgi:hypothetical protein